MMSFKVNASKFKNSLLDQNLIDQIAETKQEETVYTNENLIRNESEVFNQSTNSAPFDDVEN